MSLPEACSSPGHPFEQREGQWVQEAWVQEVNLGDPCPWGIEKGAGIKLGLGPCERWCGPTLWAGHRAFLLGMF